MNWWNSLRLAAAALGATVLMVSVGMSEPQALTDARKDAETKLQQGNFKEAYDGFRKLAFDPANDARLVARDLSHGVQCLRNLGRVDEIDEFVEGTIKVHEKNWRLLEGAAQQYLNDQHFGFMIAGKFSRGHHRGGGQMVNSLERDRVRAMQLLDAAIPLALKDENKAEVGDFFKRYASALLYNRGFYESWRLQYLTNLKELPDYEEGYPNFRSYSAAPVDAEGKPIYHALPKSWDEAKTDGEKWRYALMQATELNPNLLNQVRWELAQFCQHQFGVETMQQFGYFRFGMPSDDGDKNESGTYELHTLKENETIAKLATGIKRFEVPDEYNYIKIYQTIAAEPKTGHGQDAVNALAQVFLNRRQFPKAAEYWKQSIDQYGDQNNWKKQQLDQIVANWGQFESISTQPAGEGATVDFRFRNGKKVKFTAHAIKVDELLTDVKNYLKSDPGQLDWQKINIGDVGWQLVHGNQAKYVGEEVAAWNLDLQPRENHFDRRITVTTPLQKAGAYLVTATVEGGNVSKIVLWVADTAIVKKTLSEKNFYFVGDAVKGTPIGGASLEFFGYQQKHLGNNRWQTLTTNFAEKADADGQIFPNPADLKQDYNWLVIARGGDGRFAYHGFDGVWSGRYYDAEYNQVKVYCITDRPVYRPKQKVNFKFWVRRAQYDQENTSEFAGRTFPVVITNPKGEKIHEASLKADEFAGLDGNIELKEDAMLGVYNVSLQVADTEKNVWVAQGGNTFRVEEYKKPEFEVKVDAPTEPVMLGEKIKAKVTSKYYFGSPVVNAKVKYKVMRSEHTENWYPVAPWDWYYGPGYWWFAYDYPWYPGWKEWRGCVRPYPWWWGFRHQQPPEMVAENEAQIGPDGTFEIEIDTQIAKELHGNSDHQYTITAEVRDESRRTIVGTGNVLVARKPFKVFSWLDRGHYRVGEPIVAQFSAQTLDKKPVQGTGRMTLLKISYEKEADGKGLKVVETPMRVWDVNTNEEGRARQQLMASAKGQYRIVYKLTDKKGHAIEGAYIFTIRGEGNDGQDFRFANLELIPDKQDYQPEEKMKLQINTNQADSTVLLFLRPANGIYLAPKVIRLKGKSTVEEIEITKKDMPNFFVEAVTISGAQVYSEVKEVVVPPEKRVLNLAITPSAQEYKPGEKAKVKFTLTEFNGEPYEGSTVVSIYDKSVEYISGGSNVPDIREFFWKWRRHHQPNTQTSVAKGGHNMGLPNQPVMGPLGIFGHNVADEMDSMEELGAVTATRGQGGKNKMMLAQAKGGFGGGGPGGFAPAAPAAAFARQAQANFAANGKPGDAIALGADKADAGGDPGAPGGEQPLVEATVRSNFADTALWSAAVKTSKNGEGEVELTMPENLSAWKIRVWGMGHGTKVGSGDAEVVTRKNLILRLQAPRFFVQKDEVVLSANVHNYLKTDKEVTVSLELPEKTLKAQGELTQKIMVPAGGEKRVDWRVDVVEEGTAVVRMKALTNEESDAMEQKLPCYVHGMLKTESFAGTVRPDQQSGTVKFTIPAARRVPQSLLEVRYSPTLAGAMVDALPYLIDYPYGCTEQTLNRFLPTVITQKVLLKMNLNLADIRDKRSNLNAQEIGVDTERAKQWKRFDRNPVFDEQELDRIVKEGLKALTNMQCGDGGWGWFSGFGERSWPHTTAVVVHGLQIAQQNDVPLVPGMLDRGVEWLKRYQAEQVQWIKNAAIPNARPAKASADDLDAFIYMVLVDAKHVNAEMMDFLYRDRVNLGVYAKAMFGVALHKQGGQAEKFAMIVRNCEQFLVEDAENETAYLKLPGDTHWWYWYGSETEANAYFLKLLCLAEPKGPRAPRLVKYLLNNRKHATYWASTRDTALVVESFADYLRATGEISPNMVVELWLDGKKQKEVEIKGDNLFSFDNKLLIEGDKLTDGSHTLEIRRRGEGPVYFNAYVTNFTLEDHITAAGLEIKVNRKYYKLTPVKKEIKVVGDRGQALDQRVEKYERGELKDGDELTSGDLVEIELEIDSKNDYEYILFEDMKAAGFEPVELRSGYTGNAMGAYTEFRDNRVSFFVRALARGKHSLAYRMRAEIPGKFSALPTRASAMYAPELRGNSDEIKLKIKD